MSGVVQNVPDGDDDTYPPFGAYPVPAERRQNSHRRSSIYQEQQDQAPSGRTVSLGHGGGKVRLALTSNLYLCSTYDTAVSGFLRAQLTQAFHSECDVSYHY